MRAILGFIFLFSLVGSTIPDNLIHSDNTRPNIIFVMVDDMGYGDISSFGQTKYQTPFIDAFVAEGMKFTNAYAAAPVCTPTRVGFMTGQYPARNPIGLREPLTNSPDDIHLGLFNETPTISSILKQNGYETALFGKWHLGANKESFPLKHGFNNFFGIVAGAADYMDHRIVDRYGKFLIKKKNDNLYENESPVKKSGYLTDLITEYAVNFIHKKHEKPFFVSIQYTAPHWPWQAPDEQRTADTILYNESGSQESFAQMMNNLDENFGKLIKAVKAAGLEENTLIVFTSDNGGDRFSNMGPYKGGKMQLWEGGIRVPAAVQWPNEIQEGIHSEQPIITMDWTVTFLDVSGSQYPDTLSFDGISLVSLFKNPEKIVPRKFYWRTSQRIVANVFRDGDWKYLQNPDGEFLFNLAKDPYENNNLKDMENVKFNEMKTAFLQLDGDMLKPIGL